MLDILLGCITSVSDHRSLLDGSFFRSLLSLRFIAKCKSDLHGVWCKCSASVPNFSVIYDTVLEISTKYSSGSAPSTQFYMLSLIAELDHAGFINLLEPAVLASLLKATVKPIMFIHRGGH